MWTALALVALVAVVFPFGLEKGTTTYWLVKVGLATACLVAFWVEGRAGRFGTAITRRQFVGVGIVFLSVVFIGDVMALFPRSTTSSVVGSIAVALVSGTGVILAYSGRAPRDGAAR